jgi:hypothetical protein
MIKLEWNLKWRVAAFVQERQHNFSGHKLALQKNLKTAVMFDLSSIWLISGQPQSHENRVFGAVANRSPQLDD